MSSSDSYGLETYRGRDAIELGQDCKVRGVIFTDIVATGALFGFDISSMSAFM
jgi:hypothetical protein